MRGEAVLEQSYKSYLTTNATVIFPNTQLADYTAGNSTLAGAWVGYQPATAYHFSNNGKTATYQLQVADDSYIKCVKVELTQSGSDIAARALYARYTENDSVVGYDFDNNSYNPFSVATSSWVDGYGVAEITLNIKCHSTLTLAGVNSHTGGTVVNTGTLKITSASALPEFGGLNVYNGSDNGNYINNLKLKNGAIVAGHKLRVGYLSAAGITVSGTKACSIPAGINMVKVGEGSAPSTPPLIFDVADVTADAETDLLISGVISDFYDPNLANMPTIKRGAGTLELANANTHIGMITLEAGAISLAANNSLNGNPIVLDGGALQTGAHTNSAGTLTIKTDSDTVLGSGELAFADSAAVA